MTPTSQPQAPVQPGQQPQQPSLWDRLHDLLFASGPLKAAAQQGAGGLAPAPQAVPQAGGSQYIQDAVNKYMQEQSKKMTTPDKILAAPQKRRTTPVKKTSSFNEPPTMSGFEGAEKA